MLRDSKKGNYQMEQQKQQFQLPRVKTDKGWFFGNRPILDANLVCETSSESIIDTEYPQAFINYNELDKLSLQGFNTVRPFDDCFAVCGKNEIIIFDGFAFNTKKINCSDIKPIIFKPKMTIKAKIKPVEYKKEHQSPVEHYAIEKLYSMGFDKEPFNIKYRFFQNTIPGNEAQKFDTGFLLKNGVGQFVFYLINSSNGNFRMAFFKDHKLDFVQIEIGLEELEQCLKCNREDRYEYFKKQYGCR